MRVVNTRIFVYAPSTSSTMPWTNAILHTRCCVRPKPPERKTREHIFLSFPLPTNYGLWYCKMQEWGRIPFIHWIFSKTHIRWTLDTLCVLFARSMLFLRPVKKMEIQKNMNQMWWLQCASKCASINTRVFIRFLCIFGFYEMEFIRKTVCVHNF